MSKTSAGILAYRFKNNSLEVLLVHPGGPYFAQKDLGVWSIPKGEFTEDEDALAAARREFNEEVGVEIDGRFLELSPIKQKGGKIVVAWAVEHHTDLTTFKSNTFTLEWPPKSGKMQEFPEVDKAEWFPAPVAKQKINLKQAVLIDELASRLDTKL